MDGIAVRRVLPHIAIARVPEMTIFGIEPDDSPRAPLDLLKRVEARVEIIVARIAQNDDGSALIQRVEMSLTEMRQRMAKIRIVIAGGMGL